MTSARTTGRNSTWTGGGAGRQRRQSDHATLIVAEALAPRLTAFDIGVEGSLSNRRVWPDGPGSDGICLDADGAIRTHAAHSEVDAGVRTDIDN